MDVTKTITINGMTCKSCEAILEKKIGQLKGVKSINVSHSKSRASIVYDSYDNDRTIEAIKSTIEENGYHVPTKLEKLNMFLFIIFLVLIYLILKRKVDFNFMPSDRKLSYGLLFTIGLLSSIHCIAMCGGINLSQSIRKQFNLKAPTKYQTLRPTILYNSGRVISYTIIGGIVGGIGSVLSFNERINTIIMILAGVFMVTMGLRMLNAIPKFTAFKIKLPKLVNRSKKRRTPLIVGLLNGFMPCGPLQTVQLYALATGSIIEGSISMFLFSMGTVPLMFTLGAINNYLKGKHKRQLTKLSALLVISLGLIMLNRGLMFSPSSINHYKDEEYQFSYVKGDTQYIQTTFSDSHYQAIRVKKDIPVQWTIYISEANLNECNRTIIIPEYGIRKTLKPGRNTIEFNPSKEGLTPYYCSMRMIKSKILIVDED